MRGTKAGVVLPNRSPKPNQKRSHVRAGPRLRQRRLAVVVPHAQELQRFVHRQVRLGLEVLPPRGGGRLQSFGGGLGLVWMLGLVECWVWLLGLGLYWVLGWVFGAEGAARRGARRCMHGPVPTGADVHPNMFIRRCLQNMRIGECSPEHVIKMCSSEDTHPNAFIQR